MTKLFFLLVALAFYHPIQAFDSLRMETINGKKFVIHQVDEKETLYGLSRRYGASLEEIIEYNSQADAGLEVGQILRIPYVERTQRAVRNGNVHVVGSKETLFSISRLYQVTVADLKAWNNLADNAISVGQELVIRQPNGSIPSVAEPPVENGYHRVAAGETLFSISRTYQVAVNDIKAWNQLTGSDLSVGQVLRIVAESATPATASTTTQPPAVTPSLVQANQETTVKISEGVAGSNEVKETGLAELIDGTEGNRKYLALHRTAPTGTILKVKNELNNREVFVRVVGPLPPTGVNERLVVKISKSAYDRLGAIDSRFRVEVTFYK